MSQSTPPPRNTGDGPAGKGRRPRIVGEGPPRLPLQDGAGVLLDNLLWRVRALLELLLSLILACVAPFAFLFLLVTHAKWALMLGVLSTAVHVFWRIRLGGWEERALADGMGLKGHAGLLLLILCLNGMFWGLVLSTLLPTEWIAHFNAQAPAWLADQDWQRWAAPFSQTLESFVNGALIELLAYLLALLPFVLVPLLGVLLIIRAGVPRVRDATLFRFHVLVIAFFTCLLGYFLFGSALGWLFWGINGYIVWQGGDWLGMLGIGVVGYMPFRILALLRSGSWLRALFR